MRILFLLIVITILGIIHGYVGWRFMTSLKLSPGSRFIAWFILILLAYAPLIPAILRFNGFENRIIDIFSALGYISLGFFILTFLAFIARDLVFGLGLLGSRLLAQPVSLSLLLSGALNWGIVIVTAGLTMIGFHQARQAPVVEKVTVPVSGLPAELDGFTIAQISDIHVGPTIKRSFVENIVDIVNTLQPDIIALTGDLVDGSVSHLSREVEPLQTLRAPYGKFFITGNHEYYSGVDSWLKKTKALGFTNLINENTTVMVRGYPLVIMGVTDMTAHEIEPTHKSDVVKAARNRPDPSFSLLLAHQPGSVHAAVAAGVDLMITGHTHAGQFVPFNWLVARAHPYIEGLHHHQGMWLYVNRGSGYWGPPLRLGMTNEITLLTLQRIP